MGLKNNMRNLDKAKELKEEFENAKIEYPPYDKGFEEIKNETKELKEKIEKGCGNICNYIHNCGEKIKGGTLSFNKKVKDKEFILSVYCPQCQEAIKICEGILE